MKLLATTTLVLVFAMTAFAGNPLAGDGDALMKNTPICFQENRGQIVDADGNPRMDIAFTARVAGVQLYFRQDGISYVFSKTDEQASPQNGAMQSLRKRADRDLPESTPMQLQRMDMTLAGCNPATRIRAYDPVPGVVNYYLGHCPQGITGVREYRRIVYENIYDRIDLELLTVDGKVKYNFIVRPGGDPRAIRMQYDGATETAIRHDGSLAVGTALGGIEEQAPYTYCGSEDNAVASRFVRDGSTLRFDVAEYDATQTLVIDPWATYYGGSGEDRCRDIVTDANGDVYVTGEAWSMDFPVSAGAYQTAHTGIYADAFLLKFSSTGTRLWATYYGGDGHDVGYGICLDPQGNIGMAGVSSSNNFPVTTGAYQTRLSGDRDGFVAKFSSSGIPIWCTHAGGNKLDGATGIAVDGSGNFAICGWSWSRNFPLTGNAYLSSYTSPRMGTLMKFSGSGSLLYSTFLWDMVYGIATDATGSIIVTGSTAISTLPTTSGVFQPTFGGGSDVFIAKFAGSGSLSWVTYCGGSAAEEEQTVVTDPSGNILISGLTESTNFPVSIGAYQTTPGGSYTDGFIVKLNTSGGGMWASYLGGDGIEWNTACESDGSGNVIAALVSGSTNLTVSANAPQNAPRGADDWYVVKLDGSGSFAWGTYYGGTSSEGNSRYADVGIVSLAIGSNGYVHLCGSTGSTDIVTVGAFQTSNAGNLDAFIFQLDNNGQLPLPNQPPVAAASANPTSGTVPLTVQFTGSNSSDPENGPLTYHWDFGDNSSSTLADPSHTFTAPGTYSVILTVTDDASNSSKAFVTVDATAATSDVMYIAEMYTERIPQPGNKVLCRCRVRIKDGNGDPMHNVYVEISWTGPNSNYWFDITGPNGWCGVETAKVRDPVGLWTFYIDDVYEPGYTYDPTLNAVSLPYTEPTPKSNPGLPTSVLLHQNYPNPFNPTTVIRFELPREMAVDLVVTDALGREVWDAGGRRQYAGGEHAITFDAADLPSGIYYYRLETPDGVLARKMLLLR